MHSTPSNCPKSVHKSQYKLAISCDFLKICHNSRPKDLPPLIDLPTDWHLLVDRSVAVVLEGDGEGDDGDGHAPTADKVAQVADHATAPRGLKLKGDLYAG